MNIFDLIRSLFFFTKTTCTDIDADTQSAFVPFLLNRWFSFYGREQAYFVNETYNRYTSLFDDKNEAYKFYYHLSPRNRFKKIEYVKKKKEDKKKEEDNSALIAKNNCISKREVQMYMDLMSKVSK